MHSLQLNKLEAENVVASQPFDLDMQQVHSEGGAYIYELWCMTNRQQTNNETSYDNTNFISFHLAADRQQKNWCFYGQCNGTL